MPGPGLVAIATAAAPVVQELFEMASDWIKSYNEDPTNPELAARFQKMQAARRSMLNRWGASKRAYFKRNPEDLAKYVEELKKAGETDDDIAELLEG